MNGGKVMMTQNCSQPLEVRVGVGPIRVGGEFLARLLNAGVEVRKAPLNIYGKPQWKPANRKWELATLETGLRLDVSYKCRPLESNGLGLGPYLKLNSRWYDVNTPFKVMERGILAYHRGRRFDFLDWPSLATAELILPVAKPQNGRQKVA